MMCWVGVVTGHMLNLASDDIDGWLTWVHNKMTLSGEGLGSGHFQGCQVSGRPNLFYKIWADFFPLFSGGLTICRLG